MSALIDCRLCPRLAEFRDQQDLRYPDYHNKPVDGFGPRSAGLLVVGLAPGLHGANKTGRPFTGDASGRLLFAALYQFGFASSETSRSRNDGVRLRDCRITNAVKCVPPHNKPTPAELGTCNRYLGDEVGRARVILALGADSLRAVSLALGLPRSAFAFVHGAEYDTPVPNKLLVSYHPSRRNINTGKLTETMFEQVLGRAAGLLR